MDNITIINANSDLGVHVVGSSLGPKILTRNISKNNVINIENNIKKKELESNNKQKNLNAINNFNKNLYNHVINVINNDNFPLTIGRGS